MCSFRQTCRLRSRCLDDIGRAVLGNASQADLAFPSLLLPPTFPNTRHPILLMQAGKLVI